MRLKHIDSKDSLNLWRDGLYERQETRLVRRMLERGDVFVDVGAHIGYYTVLASNYVGEEGSVYAFEPDSENARVLKLNLGELEHENVIFRQLAVADYCGKSKLYLSRKNSGDHQLYETKDRVYCWAQVVSLDTLLDMKIDFMKIDVQGMESAVLKGAEGLIRKSPDLKILVEHSARHLKWAGSSGRELLEILKDYGFCINVMRRNVVIPLSKERIKAHKNKGLWHINLFCRREGQPA